MIEAALMCLALNVYFEARNDSMVGQYAVAQVVMNRVQSSKFPDDVCSVVKQSRMMAHASLVGTVMVKVTGHVSRMHGRMLRWLQQM